MSNSQNNQLKLDDGRNVREPPRALQLKSAREDSYPKGTVAILLVMLQNLLTSNRNYCSCTSLGRVYDLIEGDGRNKLS